MTGSGSMMQRQISSARNGRFGQYLTRCYGEDGSRLLETSPASKAELAVCRKRCDRPDFGSVSVPPLEDAFLVAIALAGDHRQRVFDGPRSEIRSHPADSLHIRHLDEDYSAHLCGPFDFLFFRVTRQALDAVAEESNSPRVTELRCPLAVQDPIAASLGRSLLPTLTSPGSANGFFVDHLALAISMHLAQTYGGLRSASPRPQGRLSRLQEKRAKEFLIRHAGDDISIASVAAECGLSRSYFIKAFKETTGTTPHKWLLAHRVRQAKELLAKDKIPIAEIAAACGFADQSHLTRVFTSVLGMPPGAWRRENAI
jgi:AraC family transcriptional regulator